MKTKTNKKKTMVEGTGTGTGMAVAVEHPCPWLRRNLPPLWRTIYLTPTLLLLFAVVWVMPFEPEA